MHFSATLHVLKTFIDIFTRTFNQFSLLVRLQTYSSVTGVSLAAFLAKRALALLFLASAC